MEEQSYSKGLEGVIADESSICFVDGPGGKLYYRGHSIEDIVARKSFDETGYLMIHGDFPSAEELAAYRRNLADEYALPSHAQALLRALPRDTHPMEALQSALAVLGTIDPGTIRTERIAGDDGEKKSVVADMDRQRNELIRLLAKIPTVIAFHHRHAQGRQPVEPNSDLDLLTNFLYMFNGEKPAARDVDIFGVCEILQMEHGFNASTFTSRVVASSLAPLHSTFAAAVGSLYGSLHGGADEAAFKMARTIGGPDAAPDYIRDLLKKGGKVMGMGHRVYKTVDPRAKVLKSLSVELNSQKGGEKANTLNTLLRVEEVMQEIMQEKNREIHANVEFYKGPVFNALDIPPENFTTMFALARAFGWGAHVLELWQDHRLYRPRAMYTGQKDVTVLG